MIEAGIAFSFSPGVGAEGVLIKVVQSSSFPSFPLFDLRSRRRISDSRDGVLEKSGSRLVLVHARSCPVARTGRRALRAPRPGSLLGALFIADGVGSSRPDAIAAMEPSFGAVCGASFFICSRLARTSSSVTETLFTLCAGSPGFCTAGAAMAWRKSASDMILRSAVHCCTALWYDISLATRSAGSLALSPGCGSSLVS